MTKEMYQLSSSSSCFMVLVFIINLLGQNVAGSSGEYHGNRRFYTAVIGDNTYVALPLLQEPLNLIFPKDTSFNQVASGIKLYSPSSNGQCADATNILEFKLMVDVDKYIRGEIKMVTINNALTVLLNLFQECGGDEGIDSYTSAPVNDTPVALEAETLTCFKNGLPFRPYTAGSDKYVMELQVSGTFSCQAFMILPQYIRVEDPPLKANATVLELNSTFAGHGDGYWWLSGNNESLPASVSFGNDTGNVRIDILSSNTSDPIFLRIGKDEDIPSFKFKFDQGCKEAKFELYLNLRGDNECRIGLYLVEGGFKVSTNGSLDGDFISDQSYSPTLVFGNGRVYVKVDSPLTFKTYPTCQFGNSSGVPGDQLVIQIAPSEAVPTCSSALLDIISSDFPSGIQVLREDHPKVVDADPTNSTTAAPSNDTTNDTHGPPSNSTPGAASEDAGFPWWWILLGLIVLALIALGIFIVYFICIRPRRNQKKARKIREVSKSAASEEVPPPTQQELAQPGQKKAEPPQKQPKKKGLSKVASKRWVYDPKNHQHPIVQQAKADEKW